MYVPTVKSLGGNSVMKIGFIGCSDITKAMMRCIIEKNIVDKNDIYATNKDKYELHKVKESLGINTVNLRREIAENCDIIILAERAEYYTEVACQIRDYLKERHIIVSTAPNMPIEGIAERFGHNVKIIRAKPNTPSIVGESMTGICRNGHVTLREFNYVCDLMRSFGVVEEVPEELIDVVIAVSSSSPAYVFMFIEAMADAASSDGMPRAQAYEFAAQAVLGSAKMILETGKHPGELKDMVCSPGGTTLEAVRVLESHGLRSSVFEAVKACAAHCKKVVDK